MEEVTVPGTRPGSSPFDPKGGLPGAPRPPAPRGAPARGRPPPPAAPPRRSPAAPPPVGAFAPPPLPFVLEEILVGGEVGGSTGNPWLLIAGITGGAIYGIYKSAVRANARARKSRKDKRDRVARSAAIAPGSEQQYLLPASLASLLQSADPYTLGSDAFVDTRTGSDAFTGGNGRLEEIFVTARSPESFVRPGEFIPDNAPNWIPFIENPPVFLPEPVAPPKPKREWSPSPKPVYVPKRVVPDYVPPPYTPIEVPYFQPFVIPKLAPEINPYTYEPYAPDHPFYVPPKTDPNPKGRPAPNDKPRPIALPLDWPVADPLGDPFPKTRPGDFPSPQNKPKTRPPTGDPLLFADPLTGPGQKPSGKPRPGTGKPSPKPNAKPDTLTKPLLTLPIGTGLDLQLGAPPPRPGKPGTIETPQDPTRPKNCPPCKKDKKKKGKKRERKARTVCSKGTYTKRTHGIDYKVTENIPCR